MESTDNDIIQDEPVTASSTATEQDAGVAAQNGRSTRVLWFKTILMAGIMLYMGMSGSMTGPTMIDLSELMNRTYEEVSRTVICRPLGGLATSFLGSFIVDRWRSRANLALGLTMLLTSTAVTAIPWSPNLITFGCLLAVQGGGGGILNIVANSLVLVMWGEKASFPAHIIQLAFTIGSTVSPSLTTEFLSPDRNQTAHIDLNELGNATIITRYMNEFVQSQAKSRIFIPYAIVGGIGVLLAAICIAIHVRGYNYETALILQRKSFRDMISVDSCTGGRRCYGFYMLISLFLIFQAMVVVNTTLNLHLTAIAVDSSLHIPKALATIMLTSTQLSSAVGRFLATILSHHLKIEILLFVELIGNLVFNMCIFFFGFDGEAYLWTFACLIAVFASPNFPTTMCWANQYMEVTGCVLYIFDTAAKGATFISAWVSALILKQYGPRYVFCVTITAAATALVLLIPLQLVSYIAKRQLQYRHVDDREDETVTDVIPDERSPLIN